MSKNLSLSLGLRWEVDPPPTGEHGQDAYTVLGDVNVPALHVAAWYDLFLGGSLRNYEGLKAHAATEQARSGQRLLIVVGGHAGNGPKIGEVDFGPASKTDEDGQAIHEDCYVLKVRLEKASKDERLP